MDSAVTNEGLARGSDASALRDGLTAGIKKFQLGQEQLELTAATLIALNAKSSLERWIRGEDVFTEGRINKTKRSV